jgi:acyl dehydratase
MSYSAFHLFFDDVAVGQEWTSAGRTVTEADIVNFAGLSGDFNPIHVDDEFAKATPFRQRMAHGLLVLSIGSGLSLTAPPMRTLAFMAIKEWHFRDPVVIGDTLHTWARVQSKEERSRGRRGVITWERKILNQKDKVVQEGVLVTLVEGRANLLRKAASEGGGEEKS